MINVVCPMYHAEVSPVSVRGRMVGTHATFLVIGYVSWSPLLLHSKLADTYIILHTRPWQVGSV